jgi:hypothetical protein
MRVAVSILTLTLVSAITSHAQSTSTLPSPCDGSYNIIRVSEIKPGMMSTFLKAVEGHKAWYAAAGAPDKIVAMRVIDRDPQTKALSYSETTIVTSHQEPVTRSQPLPPEGDSYHAFVNLYKQSSTIKSEFRTCMPSK